jgi:tetratricopeptide (TPR) repeat protein
VVTDIAAAGAPAGELAQAFRTDVFISYARENRETAALLAEVLQAQGLIVWWDRDLPAGIEFAEVIETQLQSAHVVIALWSADSVRSGFVRDESGRAAKAGKLLPVRIEEVELPLGFGQLHTLDLLDWEGDADDEPLQQLLLEVKRMKGRPAGGGDAVDATRRRFDRLFRLPRYALVALVGIVIALLGYGGKVMWDKEQADTHFRAGLRHHHANEPRLVNALNDYLSALEYRPRHGRTRYYLAHVYAQLGQPADALESFRLALGSTESPLDRGQRAQAQQQLTALAIDPNEAPPIARTVATTAPQPPEPPLRSLPRPAPDAGAPAPAVVGGGIASGGAAPSPLARRPPRIDAAEPTLSRLAVLVDGMFDDNKEQRITATTSLVVDPEALSDAVPLALVKAHAVLRARGGAGVLTQSGSSGIVNTLVLLQSALPGTLDAQRRPIDELLAATASLGEATRQHAAKVGELMKLAATRKPVAYIQIANEAQRPIADAMSVRLRSFGYDTPAVELVGARAPARTELRVQGKSDRGFARWIARVIAETSGDTAAVSTLRNARPQADAYEIWLDRDLCAPGGREVVACRAAP